jgi:hypothetical protein
MNTLRRLQEDFQGYLLALDNRMHPHVLDSTQVSAEERLAIYANAYRLRLLEALDTDYPGLHTILGDDEFDAMGRAYIAAHPSGYFSLRWFGERMAGFLRTTEPYSKYPVFAEMAAFEWAKSDAFDAADSAVAGINDMATISPDAWPGLRFIPHPSLRRLDLRWNVATVWKEIDAAQEPPALEESDYPIAWLVWRQGLLTYFRSLSVDEAWALDALYRGETFAAICEGLTEWIDAQNVALHASGLLKQWLLDGLISEIATEKHSGP